MLRSCANATHIVAVEIFLSLLFLSWELDLFELIHRSALMRSIGGGENKSCAGQKLSGVAGSPAFVAAPEVLLGDYSEKVDIWVAGVLLHLLLVGGLPFDGGSLEAVFEAIKKTELGFTCG
ncbi:hypothetical protein MUK42_35103, partial [Musa troglodytarum]